MHKQLLVVFDLFFSLELSYVYNYNKKLPKKKILDEIKQIKLFLHTIPTPPKMNKNQQTNKQTQASKKNKNKIKLKKTHTPKPKQTN